MSEYMKIKNVATEKLKTEQAEKKRQERTSKIGRFATYAVGTLVLGTGIYAAAHLDSIKDSAANIFSGSLSKTEQSIPVEDVLISDTFTIKQGETVYNDALAKVKELADERKVDYNEFSGDAILQQSSDAQLDQNPSGTVHPGDTFRVTLGTDGQVDIDAEK